VQLRVLKCSPNGLYSYARQADIYRAIASACLTHPGCSAIQTWGFTDKYSWIGWKTKGVKGNALLFDRYYAPKPAYAAIDDACRNASPAHTTTTSP
jgi:endo-1,4-beta-xylanase